MKSSDAGITWTTIDNFDGGGANPGYDAGITSDAARNLYAAGWWSINGPYTQSWFIRRSTDGGATWSTVDALAPTNGASAEPKAMATDSSGNVYVVGFASGLWLVRKGTTNPDGSMTWNTVDQGAANSNANGVFCHPTAGVFVVGNVGSQWRVRRSLDGGITWATVDSYQFDTTGSSAAHGLGADAAGNLYVVGSGSQVIKRTVYNHWLVRKSSNGGSTWATVDNYQPASNQNAFAYGFGADSHGNLFVIGERYDPTGNHWVVRTNPGGTGSWSTADDFQYAPAKVPMAEPCSATAPGISLPPASVSMLPAATIGSSGNCPPLNRLGEIPAPAS